jgi:hypothetical protein
MPERAAKNAAITGVIVGSDITSMTEIMARISAYSTTVAPLRLRQYCLIKDFLCIFLSKCFVRLLGHRYSELLKI